MYSTATSSSGGDTEEKFIDKLKRWGESLVNCWRRCADSECCDKKGHDGEEGAPLRSPVRDDPVRNPNDLPQRQPSQPTEPRSDTFEHPEDQEPPIPRPVCLDLLLYIDL